MLKIHRTVLLPFLTWVFFVYAVSNGHAGDGLEPAESLKKIHIADGLRIELIASEPDIVSPVAVAWDEYGRMFVVEMRDYPNGPGEGDPFLSRVKLLEDREGDGRYQTISIFADQLPFANGVLPWQGGVIVTAAPDIWFLKDTDGDGKADVREKLFTGFKEGNPQLRVNHPTLGIDNWIYVANGLSGGEVRRADNEDSAKVPLAQMDFRFRPDRSEFEATAGNAQFGLVFDDFGNRFMCSNRQHVAHVVLPDRYLKRNPFLGVAKTVLDIPDHGAAARIFPLAATRTTAVEHAGTFTAACGLTVYRGSGLPPAYRGNSFVCDPTGYLVHRDVLVPAGATFIAKRAPEDARQEFLASTDEWFRPVNLANSPDGCLVLVDMYRETIEHPQYMPKGLAETLDLRKGDDRGRLYRITGESGPRPIATWPATMDSKQLVQALGHPDAWWRETAQRLLVERHDATVLETLSAFAQSAPDAVAAIHALWTLEGIGGLQESDLLRAMNDRRAAVREQAVRLIEPLLGTSPVLSQKLVALAGDPDSRVRFRVALALGQVATDSSAGSLTGHDLRIKPLAKIIERDAEDPWVQIAVLSSAAGIAGELWSNIDTDFTRIATPSKSSFVERLASIVGARRDTAEIDLFLSTFVARHGRADTWWQLAAINGLASALKGSGKSLGDIMSGLRSDVKPAAKRVERLLTESSQIVRNKDLSVPERVAAAHVISNLPTAELAPIVRELLDVSQPQEVQLAAVQAIDSVSNSAVVPILLDGWSSHSPPVRREVVEAIFRRRERIMQLLDAIEAGKLKAADLDLNRHQQLLDHSVKEVKERAERLFANEGTPNRKEVIESYRGVLAQSGNAERGRDIFKKNCATCHQIQGEGHRVGPELTGLRSRNKEAVLMDILDPNRALEPNYANYLIATKDGRVLSGIIASENATSITLRRAEGVEDVLLRQDLEQIRASGQSLMPEGLERNVTQAEMVDLIEYLRSVP
jgi:putative membrane-bound dehydrogenase-like protein